MEEQIGWYDRKSTHNQRWFKGLKVVVIGAAALTPLAASAAPPAITGALGVLIVIVEGIQHLNQYQANWTSYRSTCEALKHEKYLYLAKAGPYSAAADPHALLAERVESLVSREHAQWVSGQEQAAKGQGGAEAAPQ